MILNLSPPPSSPIGWVDFKNPMDNLTGGLQLYHDRAYGGPIKQASKSICLSVNNLVGRNYIYANAFVWRFFYELLSVNWLLSFFS